MLSTVYAFSYILSFNSGMVVEKYDDEGNIFASEMINKEKYDHYVDDQCNGLRERVKPKLLLRAMEIPMAVLRLEGPSLTIGQARVNRKIYPMLDI